MTDIKKKQTGKTAAKAQKLRLNKETLKDLTGRDLSAGDKAKAVKGGQREGYSNDPDYCSDRRIKTGIRPLANALATIDRVRPVAFHYTDEYRQGHPSIQAAEYYNVIAQEFAEIFPQAVTGSGEQLADGSEILQVDTYPAMIHALAAIQELHGKVKVLAQENAALRRQLAGFTKRLSDVEDAMATQPAELAL